jgi:hypothetical protein
MPIHHLISYCAIDRTEFVLRLVDALAAAHPEGAATLAPARAAAAGE